VTASTDVVRREYPAAPIVAVGVIVRRGGQVLLVQRGKPPSEGRWSLPGGMVNLGESLREAAAREISEECGLEITVGEVVEVFEPIIHDEAGRVRYHYVVVDFLAEYVGGELTVASDITDARWVTVGELESLDVTPAAAELVRKVLSEPAGYDPSGQK